ncbi:MAG TPA: mechanosensitive ion channel family protein [Pyrinomonadaceae bacterium]|jgi:small-conductance mechanosensitive channel|nr:mechanosensitive ion channel family protein [Pyrinomonadaceae bacterium]
MPAPDLKKKALVFVLFAGVVTLLLLIFPFIEGSVREYIAVHFGLLITPEGNPVASDGNNLPGKMTETTVVLITTVFHILKILLWMVLVITIVRFLSYLIFETVLKTSGQSEISSLVKTVLSVIIYIVAFFVIFQSQYPNVPLAPLFTGSTILGIVVGLALQETLGNLFAGIALQADQPFQVGDVINISNRGSGVVESVSWRGVKIRTFQNKLLIISNAVLGKEVIEVAPRGNLNARVVYFSTLYVNSPAKTAQLVREAVRHVENVSPKLRPIVRIKNLGDSGIEFEIKYWIEDYTKYNDTDAAIRQRVWYLFQREKIEFSYPTRTIHIETKPQETAFDETINMILERLSGIPIFAPLSDDELQRLSKAAAKRVYAPGESIVRMGKEGNSMFIIVRGNVNVQIPDNGVPKVVNRLYENDFFGEMSLLTGEPRSATVVAVEETEVLQIRKNALKPIFESNPELMKLVCEIVEERRGALATTTSDIAAAQATDGRSVLQSIKNFFGFK